MVAYTYTGGAGNDTLYALRGVTINNVNGGAGVDTLWIDRMSQANYTVSAPDASGVTTLSGASGSVFYLTDIEQVSFNGVYWSVPAPVDSTAPTLYALNPAGAAGGVAITSNIDVTFNEAIQRGAGSIVLTDAAGTIIETFDVATSPLLTISGLTLTINPTNDLPYNTACFATFAPGTITDLAGNAYAGTTSYYFTTIAPPDTTAPTVSAVSPASAAVGVALASDIVATFSETIQRGTGSIVLTDAAGTVIETFDTATSSNLSISGATLTINPTSDLAYSTHYLVAFAPGTITDQAGNAYAGITTYNFTTVADTVAPTVSTFSPTSAAVGVAITSNIAATFSEAIQRGAGSIVLKNAAGTTIETFDAATSSLLSISGTNLTINPTVNFANNTNYFVTFVPGTINDLAGNAYAGNTTYNFTTIAATTAGNDTITAGTDNDTLTGGAGNDIIDGGAGTDIATYSAVQASYSITKTSTGYTVSGGTDGSDTLANIERLNFTDKKVAIDLDGNAGITAKILGAVFGTASVSNTTYMGIGLSYLDGGMSYADLMALALNAAGATTSNAVVTLLWTNLFGLAPTAAEAAPYAAILDSGSHSTGTLGVLAADTSYNTTNINLVGLVQTGIEYL